MVFIWLSASRQLQEESTSVREGFVFCQQANMTKAPVEADGSSWPALLLQALELITSVCLMPLSALKMQWDQ